MLDARSIKHLRLPILVNLAPQALTLRPAAWTFLGARTFNVLFGKTVANLICIKIKLACLAILLGGNSSTVKIAAAGITHSLGEIGSDLGHSTGVLPLTYCSYLRCQHRRRMKGSLLVRRGKCIASSV